MCYKLYNELIHGNYVITCYSFTSKWGGSDMEQINILKVQEYLNGFINENLYFHLETSNGAYSTLEEDENISICTFIRNNKIQFDRGVITGEGPYRVGLRLAEGWLYAEGLTDWEVTKQQQLLLAGHDKEGRVLIALELSREPFHAVKSV